MKPGGFAPGNTLARPATQVNSVVKEHRKLLRSLALHIRERVDIDKLITRLETMAEGKDPVTGEPIGVREQREAIKVLLERGYGMPAMHVVVEGEVRNEVITVAPSVERKQMTLEQINAERARYAALGVRAQQRVIDVLPQLVETVTPDGEE